MACFISDSSASNLVGTSGQDGANDAIERNVISGNTNAGVLIGTLVAGGVTTGPVSGNIVAGNLIGTNTAGTAPIPNAYGVEIVTSLDAASGNFVGVNSVYGPASADQRNVISGNITAGVEITGAGAAGNVVAGDYIGINAAGTGGAGERGRRDPDQCRGEHDRRDGRRVGRRRLRQHFQGDLHREGQRFDPDPGQLHRHQSRRDRRHRQRPVWDRFPRHR